MRETRKRDKPTNTNPQEAEENKQIKKHTIILTYRKKT